MKPSICTAIIIALVTFGATADVFGTPGTQLPPVTFAPASLSFGNQIIAVTSVSQSVTLTNNQSVALNVSSVTTTTGSAHTNNSGRKLCMSASYTKGQLQADLK
jgi:hypothetical protein